MVTMTRPRSFVPSRGVFLPLEAKREASTVHSASGSKMVTSAGDPGFSVPRSAPRKRAGRRRQTLDQRRQGESAPVHQRHERAERRLQHADPEGGLVESRQFLDAAVRRVVGGNHVDGAVDEGLDHRLHVGPGAPEEDSTFALVS